MKLFLSLVSLLFSVFVHSQNDTIQAIINKRKINSNYVLYDQKIGVVIENKITYNTNRVHDYFINILDKSSTGLIVIKLVDKRGHIFAIGKWNESGFQGNVTYYNRRGKVKSVKKFTEETYDPNMEL